MFFLHGIGYFPTVIVTTLYYIFGSDDNSSFTQLLDETSIFLLVYVSPNCGLIIHSIGFSLFLWIAIFNSSNASYWILFGLYLAFAIYTHFFSISEGVEAVRAIKPLWRGTRSGLLWPLVLKLIGLVDDDDEARYIYDNKQSYNDKSNLYRQWL